MAEAKDITFNIRRRAENPRRGWSQYNQQTSYCDPPTTTIGYMPIILSPAHEYDSLNTVIVRCRHIAETLGQKYVVYTVGEALFSRLMALKWSQESYSFFDSKIGFSAHCNELYEGDRSTI